MSTWFYRITKTSTTKRDAWLMGDMLSWRGPSGGKFLLTKLGPKAFEMSAVVSSDAVDKGEVKEIVGSDSFGISPIIVES